MKWLIGEAVSYTSIFIATAVAVVCYCGERVTEYVWTRINYFQ